MPTQWPTWDWGYVLGSKRSRKPAIKKQQWHQHHFSNPNYDPSQPLPPKILPPHAPIAARGQDEWQIYHAGKPTHRQRSDRDYRAKFMRWLHLRDVDWRTAFQLGLAADQVVASKQTRMANHVKRQKCWQAWRARHGATILRQLAGHEQSRQVYLAGLKGGLLSPGVGKRREL